MPTGATIWWLELDEVVQALRALPDTQVMIGSAENDTPESNWGNAFAMYAPGGEPADTMPFATVVIADMEGDESSRLSRPGVYRLNLGVGRQMLVERADPDAATDTLDRWIRHPVYATQGWISILSPSDERRDEVTELVGLAHQRAAARHHR